MGTRPKSKIYEILNHSNNLAIEVYGDTMDEIYNNSVRAMTDLLVGLKGLRGSRKKELEIMGVDEASFLVNLLNELVFLYEIDNMVSTGISSISTEGMTMHVTIKYQIIDHAKKPVINHIKSTKLQGLKIKRLDDGYHSMIVFDV